jgi:hypothetical protein
MKNNQKKLFYFSALLQAILALIYCIFIMLDQFDIKELDIKSIYRGLISLFVVQGLINGIVYSTIFGSKKRRDADKNYEPNDREFLQ